MSETELVTAGAAAPATGAGAAPPRPSPRPRPAPAEDSPEPDSPHTGTVESETLDDDAEHEEAEAGPADAADEKDETEPVSGSRFTAVVAVLVVVVLALAAGVTILFLRVGEQDDAAARDQTIVDSAKQMVVNLTTLKQATAQQDIDRLLQGSTGQFRQQFGDASGSFQTVLQQAKVDSTGDVKEAAIESSDDQKASVLVAAAATVKNTDAPQGQSRVYRMRVSLENSNGKWLVSNVEFVP